MSDKAKEVEKLLDSIDKLTVAQLVELMRKV